MSSKSLTVSTAALIGAITMAPVTVATVPAAAAPTEAAARSASKPQVRQMPMRALRSLAPRTREVVQHRRIGGSGGYQGQRRCMPGSRPGTRAVKRLLHTTYDPSIRIGLSRHCGGDTSEHYDGRALDWMTNWRNPRQAAQADAFVGWLTGKERGIRGANARRLGVMYIIWRGRMWRAYDPGWRDYNGCSRGGGNPTACHRDHVHISLTWRGAYKKTSWYR